MLFINDFKKYDTELSEEICSGSMIIPDHNELLGFTFNYSREGTLYRTSKGSYFFVFKRDNGRSYMKLLTEIDAKKFISKNDYSKWVELFGEMEEG